MVLFLTYNEHKIRSGMDRNYWDTLRTLKDHEGIHVHDVRSAPVPAEVLVKHSRVVLDPFATPLHPGFRREHEPWVLQAAQHASSLFLTVPDAHPHTYSGGMEAVHDFAKQYNAEVICMTRSSMEPFRLDGIPVHHLPHHIDSSIHYVRTDIPKRYDIVMYGTSHRRFYPFRARLFHLLKPSLFRVLTPAPFRVRHIKFPGYAKYDRTVCGRGLAEQINMSWIGICTCATARYLVAKYLEVVLNGTVVAGNLPDAEEERLWGSNYIALDDGMSDDTIVSTLKHALDDKARLREMSEIMRHRLSSFTLQHVARRLLEIVEPRVNSFALVLTVSAVERQRQNEGHVAYPSTQFLLAKRREREVPNDPRRQHTRVPAAGSAGDAAQWQRECDVSPVRRVSDGVLSVARSADALRARRAASETADRPAGAAPRAHRDRRTAGHRGSAGVADARAAVGERSPGPTGAGHRPGDGLARLAAGRA